MNKLSMYKKLIVEIKKQAVISILGTAEADELYDFTKDDAYYHFVVNTIRNKEGYTVDDLLEDKIYDKFRIYVSSAWNSNKKVKIEIAGFNIILDKSKSGYSDFYEYLNIKDGLKASTSILNKIIEDKRSEDFEILFDDPEWYIVYPKTQLGSMALGRSYWDVKENKLKYDLSFNPSYGIGSKTGEISWCTVADGENNHFLSYHMHKKLHMFYCISKRFGVEDNKRKICLSLEKEDGNVNFSSDELSCVDGNNDSQDEEFFRRNLGERYNKLIKYTEDNLEEIDFVSYYSNYNLIQYNSQYENPDIPSEIGDGSDYTYFEEILRYTLDKRIFYAAFNSNIDREGKLKKLLESDKTPFELRIAIAEVCDDEDELKKLAFQHQFGDVDQNIKLKIAIANNPNTSSSVLMRLANIENNDIRLAVANNYSTSETTLYSLSKIDNDEIRLAIANNIKSEGYVLNNLSKIDNRDIQLAVLNHPNTDQVDKDRLKKSLSTIDELLADAKNPETSPDYLFELSMIENDDIRLAIANNPNTDLLTLYKLSEIENDDIRLAIANNHNTEWHILYNLTKIENDEIRFAVANNPNANSFILSELSKIDNRAIQQAVLNHPNTDKKTKDKIKAAGVNESYYSIKKYILSLLN